MLDSQAQVDLKSDDGNINNEEDKEDEDNKKDNEEEDDDKNDKSIKCYSSILKAWFDQLT